MTEQQSLQEWYAPNSTCFGCGPANPKGLRIGSFLQGSDVVMRFRARSEHEAFPGYLNGGIAGALVDCHMNWTATHALMQRLGLDAPPCTVTASYSIRFIRPIPTADEIEVVAHTAEVRDDRATVDAVILSNGRECATASGTFVAVKEGHPAYHRW